MDALTMHAAVRKSQWLVEAMVGPDPRPHRFDDLADVLPIEAAEGLAETILPRILPYDASPARREALAPHYRPLAVIGARRALERLLGA